MKKIFILTFLLILPAPGTARVFAALDTPAPVESIPPSVKSAAYQQYKKRPHSELSKLICLTDMLKRSEFEVIYNGRTYQPRSLSALISTYVRLNYKKETAEDWIAKYAYRSVSKGRVIYLKDPGGETLVLKDVLLQELKTLPV